MRVVFVHGWSVTDTATYGLLPEALATQAADYGLTIDVTQIWLGRYISFDDTVGMNDVVRAFEQALKDQIPDYGAPGMTFSCITHSTGGPVVREWMERYWGAKKLNACPMRHLVMLAPANHGSPLAKLGKEKVGRIKAWFSGVEPGAQILRWLSLGSQEQIDLARKYVDYAPVANGLYPFVLTGETIDKHFYDYLNRYLIEAGSDGVVRVAGANMNYSMVRLTESDQERDVTHENLPLTVRLLDVEGGVMRPEPVGMGIVPSTSHSGTKMGIMASVRSKKSSRVQVVEILKCLQVDSANAYGQRRAELEALSQQTQKSGKRFVMLVFVLEDDQGNAVDDYDLFLLGKDTFSPAGLSKGFFVDRQKNTEHPNHLVYYVNYDTILKNGLTGLRVIARPTQKQQENQKGSMTYYHPVQFQADGLDLGGLLMPNETFYIHVTLKRCVDKNVFRFDPATDPQLREEGMVFKSQTRHDFKKIKPSGDEVES